MVVAYSRDHEGVGVAHEIVSPKKPASIFPDDGAVLLGKTEMLPKIATEFLKIFYWLKLTNAECNLTMAKAMSFAVQHCLSPRGAF